MVLRIVFLSGLFAAVLWKLAQLVRDPRNAPLRSLALCLLSAAASYPLTMPQSAEDFDMVAFHGAAKLVQNLLLLATLYFLMAFFLYSAADESAGQRRARREAGLVFAVAVVITLCAVAVPEEELAGSFSTADMTVSQVAGFYLVAGLYMTYALAAAGMWTRHYARASRRPHSTGLWIAAWGMSGMAVACAVRAVFVVTRWAGGAIPEGLLNAVEALLVVSIMAFVLGITYLGAWSRYSASRLWLSRRRTHRRLEPLWRLLSETYPDTVLQPQPTWAGRLRARGVHRRYHRRIVEIRDGLLRISPHLYASSGDDLLALDPPELARRLRAATAKAGTGARAAGTAFPLAAPDADGREADARQLVKLADALRVSA
ncbi:MAB_1171c family putative transporter [Streptomyces sp. NPDC051018]|uniref:MAB_1171c family putative transporter n=1 Tax=Streptomyces sp. NPDC051018 TaxID=3365639 RepID=UPI00378768D7